MKGGNKDMNYKPKESQKKEEQSEKFTREEVKDMIVGNLERAASLVKYL